MSVLDYTIETTMPDADFLYFFKELGATKDFRISKANFLKEVVARVLSLETGTVSLTGNQSINGIKTFIEALIASGGVVTTVVDSSQGVILDNGTVDSPGVITRSLGFSDWEKDVVSGLVREIYGGIIKYSLDNAGNGVFMGTVDTTSLNINNGLAAGGVIALKSAGFSDWFSNNESGTHREYYGGSVKRTIAPSGNVNYTNNVHVGGTLSKAAGTFDIPHVLPELQNTIGLRHSFVESPIISNIYYGSTKLKKGKASINIDKEYGMTEGTLLGLNTDLKPFTSNESSFIRTKSKLVGNILKIQAEDLKCTDEVYWEVKGRRHDKYVMEMDITDDDGKLIVEYVMGKTLEEIEIERLEEIRKYNEKQKKIADDQKALENMKDESEVTV